MNMLVYLGWYPKCLTPTSPLKGDIPNEYPLYKVYMGLIIRGPPCLCFKGQVILSTHFKVV